MTENVRQAAHRAKKLQEGWMRVDALLDPEHAKIWKKLAPKYEGKSDLVRAALQALADAGKGKR